MAMVHKITDIKTFYGFLKELIFNFKETRMAGKVLDSKFINKILLAVTEVNGCRLCNYVHSKNALKHGVNQEEIDMLLSKDYGALSKEEAEAIFFAQHYADTRSQYDKEAYEKMESHLGKEKSRAVVGTIRKIMFGNTYGIALDLIKMRLSGKPDKESSVLDEFGIVLGTFVMIPVLIIQKLFKSI